MPATKKKASKAKKKTTKKKTKPKEDPSPIGRPSKYKKEYCLDLVEHMAEGGAIQTFPAVLYNKYQVIAVRDTIYEWAKKHKDFSDSKKLGESLSQHFFMSRMIDSMEGRIRVNVTLESENGENVEYQRPQNLGARATFPQSSWIFVMKNRFSQDFKDSAEVTTKPGDPDDIAKKKAALRKIMSDPKLASAAAKVAQALADAKEEEDG